MQEVLYTDGGEIRFATHRVFALHQPRTGDPRLVELRDARDIARRYPTSRDDGITVVALPAGAATDTLVTTFDAEFARALRDQADWTYLSGEPTSAAGPLMVGRTDARRATRQDHVTPLNSYRKARAISQLAALPAAPSPAGVNTATLWLSVCASVGPARFEQSVAALSRQLERSGAAFDAAGNVRTKHDFATQLRECVPSAKLLAEARHYRRPMSPAVASLRPDYGARPARCLTLVAAHDEAVGAMVDVFLDRAWTPTAADDSGVLHAELDGRLDSDTVDFALDRAEMLNDPDDRALLVEGLEVLVCDETLTREFVSWGDDGDPNRFTLRVLMTTPEDPDPRVVVVRCRAIDTLDDEVAVAVLDVFEPHLDGGWDPAGSGSRVELEAFVLTEQMSVIEAQLADVRPGGHKTSPWSIRFDDLRAAEIEEARLLARTMPHAFQIIGDPNSAPDD